MQNSSKIIILFIFFLSVSETFCDLPVHCLKHQIEGEWIAKLSPNPDPQEKYIKCGHEMPDNPQTSLLAMRDSFQEKEQFDFTLKAGFDSFSSQKGSGSWTMIYDEGFEFRLDQSRFFAFNQYYQGESGFESNCSATLVGWYHDYSNNEKGCFKAEKKQSDDSMINKNSDQNLHIVQPEFIENKQYLNKEVKTQNNNENQKITKKNNNYANYINIKNREKNYQQTVDKNNGNQIKSQLQNKNLDSIKEEQKKSNPLNKQQQENHEQLNFQQKTSSKFKLSTESYSQEFKGPWLDIKPIPSVNDELLSFNQDFMEHQKVADRLNKRAKKSWQAGVDKMFLQMNLKQMNKFAGRHISMEKLKTTKMDFKESRISLLEKSSGRNSDSSHSSESFKHYSRQDVSDLPKNFDWMRVVKPARAQGDCGSCYIFSTMAMLEARLKIKTGEDIRLSPQHSLDCNFYNQGCDGGYPFLVGKFANEYELVPEDCHPYIGRKGSCNTCDVNSLDKVYKVKDYKFIGEAYGKNSERQMMLEIMQNGPVVVSFEPKYDFMYYKSGIYHSLDANQWIQNGESQPEWEKVDHSVLCVGWGEQDNEHYWILQNTWGDNWGENGFFKMRRGTDESGIESMAEAYEPYVQTNHKQHVFLQKKINQLFLRNENMKMKRNKINVNVQ